MAEKSEELVTRDEKITQAKELFRLGYRNYLLKCYSDAADDLSQACALNEELYGELADELGKPYLLYAKCLIALAQDENKVLDLPDVEDDEDNDEGVENEKEKPECAEEEEEEEEEEEQSHKSDDTHDNNKIINGNKDNETEKLNGQDENVNEPIDVIPGTSNGNVESNDENNEDDEVTTNLQVAWEILELAAKIFERQGGSSLANLAEVYENLAGISFENGHFEAAISDYEKALNMHSITSNNYERVLAEIYYKIALAHMMLNSFDNAIEYLQKASDCITDLIEKEKSKELSNEQIKVIQDLESSKMDILAKIVEIGETKQQSFDDVKKELSKLISTKNNDEMDGAGPSSSSSNKTEATNISHLIKRKRTKTPPLESTESPAKRSST